MNLREALQAIYDERGELTPQLVVEAARQEGHALHGRFEWDDSVAAESWRRSQAQELIRSVKIVYRQATGTEPARTTRAFQAVRNKDGYAYRPTEEVARNPFLHQLMLNEMERDWKALHRRYRAYAEFAALVRGDIEADPGQEAA